VPLTSHAMADGSTAIGRSGERDRRWEDPGGGEGAPAAPRTWRRGRRRPCCSPATRRAPSPSPVRREAADPTGHRARGQPDRPWPVARGRGPVGRDPDHAAVARAPVHPSPVSDLAARGGARQAGIYFPGNNAAAAYSLHRHLCSINNTDGLAEAHLQITSIDHHKYQSHHIQHDLYVGIPVSHFD